MGRQQQDYGGVAEALLTASGSVIPILVLTVMVPTFFSFWRAGFGPAWALLALGLGGLAAATLVCALMRAAAIRANLPQPQPLTHIPLPAGSFYFLT